MQELFDRVGSLDVTLWSGPAIIALRITLIVVAAWIGAAILNRMIRLFRDRITQRFTDREQVRRAETGLLHRVLLHGNDSRLVR